MRHDVACSESSIAPLLGLAASAVFVVAFVLLTPLPASAGADGPAMRGQRLAPHLPVLPLPDEMPSSRGASASEHEPVGLDTDPRDLLDRHDRLAVYQAIHLALSELGDGASYVWHRSHGRLSGVVQVISTRRSRDGGLCRRLGVLLTSGRETRKIETSACRLPDRSWQFSRS